MSLYLQPNYGFRATLPIEALADALADACDPPAHFQQMSTRINNWIKDPANNTPHADIVRFDTVGVHRVGFAYSLSLTLGGATCIHDGGCFADDDLVLAFDAPQLNGPVESYAQRLRETLDFVLANFPKIADFAWDATPARFFSVTS